MKIKDILLTKLKTLYSNESQALLEKLAKLIEPELETICNTFYDELMNIPELSGMLNHVIVRKNLKKALSEWIVTLFRPHNGAELETLIKRQQEIGSIHADLNVSLNYFTHGVSILKREVFSLIFQKFTDRDDFTRVFILVDRLFDALVSIISEGYFSHEILHEANELSIKMKGVTQNTAIECERLRYLLLDWLRGTLTILYETPKLGSKSIPLLQYSNFGLWVIYKADLISPTLDISTQLRTYIDKIDQMVTKAAELHDDGQQEHFFQAIGRLNEYVTQTSWFISSIVDQVVELDTGMDPLTRLFNRRYLNTILRRQTDIAVKQDLPYSIILLDLDFFKKINDTHGHDSGDLILKQFSELLLFSTRTSDFVFRFGGEEFLIVVGNASLKEARNIAEKIRQKCANHVFRLSDNLEVHNTCSIGVATYDGHPDYERVIKLADEALYTAKTRGRNRVVVADQ